MGHEGHVEGGGAGAAEPEVPVEAADWHGTGVDADEPEVISEPPKVQQSPVDPTPDQVESHICGGHIEFQPWCLDCIKGRAQEWAHYQTEHSGEELPTIYWDYAYLGTSSEGRDTPDEEQEEERKGSSPMLIA